MSDYHHIRHLRSVRSYVQRSGRMTPRQLTALTHLWPEFGLEIDQDFIKPSTIFARSAPLVVEIGFGMGHSLLQMALQNPDKDFIGIEVHRPGIGALLAKAKEFEVNNLRIYAQDALEVLNKCIPDESIDAILLFFPDPWPKKRHHKRRIVQNSFIQLVLEKLKPEGYIHIATDVNDYAEHTLNLFKDHKGFAQRKTIYDRPITKFEKRGEKLGHTIHDMVFSKII